VVVKDNQNLHRKVSLGGYTTISVPWPSQGTILIGDVVETLSQHYIKSVARKLIASVYTRCATKSIAHVRSD